MDWMSWTKFTRFLSLKGALGGLAGLGIATAGLVSYGGGSSTNWTDNGSVPGAPGVVRGAPGPVAGTGLPLVLIAAGFGIYRLVRRHQRSD
jgi:hypothetical protein